MTDLNALVDSLVRRGYLKNLLLIEAFRKVDRRDFVISAYAAEAYADEALPIGYGQTISQPLTVAFMLELLDPQPGERILDVGAGSGWKAALLAHVASQSRINADSTLRHGSGQARKSAETVPRESASLPRKSAGHVVTIERIPELKAMAEQNIARYSFIEKKIVEVILGDGSAGHPEGAPYDRIIAGAAAERDIPDAWREQVKIGGRIVAPVGHSIMVYDRVAGEKFQTREHFGFSFVPLIRG